MNTVCLLPPMHRAPDSFSPPILVILFHFCLAHAAAAAAAAAAAGGGGGGGGRGVWLDLAGT
jgi:hypothetical protein